MCAVGVVETTHLARWRRDSRPSAPEQTGTDMPLCIGHLLTPARLSLCAVGVTAVTLLAACGGSDSTSAAPAGATGGRADVRTHAGPDGPMILVDPKASRCTARTRKDG
jgi:hypothetical protein